MSNITNVNVTALALEVRAEVCHPYVSILETSYGYYPSFAAGVVFCVLFALPTIYNVFRSIQFRAATSILLALGAFSESNPLSQQVIINTRILKSLNYLQKHAFITEHISGTNLGCDADFLPPQLSSSDGVPVPSTANAHTTATPSWLKK